MYKVGTKLYATTVGSNFRLSIVEYTVVETPDYCSRLNANDIIIGRKIPVANAEGEIHILQTDRCTTSYEETRLKYMRKHMIMLKHHISAIRELSGLQK
jgi:hypothetical protein